MANVNDVLSGESTEKSYYYDDGTSKPKFTPLYEGDYLGHITEVSTRVVEWQNYKARVYNFKVKVHKDNDLANSSGFAGREIKSIGVFRYLEPEKGDTFVSHPSGNRNYLNFCNALGIECPVEKKKIGGKDVEVKMLPSISQSDVEGSPVKAIVKKGKPYTDKKGVQRNYMDVKWVERWEDGEKINTGGNGDEIPF